VQAELAELVAAIARNNLKNSIQSSDEARKLLFEVLEKRIDPHSAAQELIHDLFNKQT
jgi:hypothetical protein